jgi:hypothetical protein
MMQIADYLRSGGARPEEFALGLNKEFQPEEFALGLNKEFQTLEGHDIGQFSGLESSTGASPIQAYQLST